MASNLDAGMDSTLATRLRIACVVLTCLICFPKNSGAASPPNDSFKDAVEFVLNPVIPTEPTTIQFTGTLAGATIESDETNNLDLATYNQRGTIWWKWNCTTSSVVEFIAYSMTGSVMAAAFEGDGLANLTTVSTPMMDPFLHPEMTFDAGIAAFHGYPGRTYWFVLIPLMDLDQPVDFIEGQLTISPSEPPPPPPQVVAPTNDHFANRTALIGTNWSVNGNIEAATLESGEAIGFPWNPLQASAWYTWTSPTNGVVYFTGTIFVSNPTFRLTVFRGPSLASLTTATLTADGGYLVAPGDTLQLQVGSPYTTGWAPTNGSGAFALSALFKARAPASANDLFGNRLDISTPTYHFEGSIYNATSESGEPYPSGGLSRTLWWRFLPPEDGLLRINLSGPYPLSATVYEGNSFASMMRVENRFTNRFAVTAGREYSIQIGSGNAPSGGIKVDTLFRSTSNDMFAGAIRMEGTNCFAESDFGAATFETGEPNPGDTNTIWFSWASPGTGRVWYSPYSEWWRPAAVYSGYSLETLTPVREGGRLGNGEGSFLAEEGKVYYFQYSGASSETVKLALRLDPFTPSVNDDFADAAKMPWGTVIGSILGATMEAGEPAHRGYEPSKSIWWKWQAPLHLLARFQANGGLASNVVMAAYQGTSVDTLTLVAKGTNELNFSGDGGKTYYIAAAVPEDTVGDVMFHWQWNARGSGGVTPSIPVPGNLLREPSWEATFLETQYWQRSAHIGGNVNSPGGADGATWPVVGGGTSLWQDIEVIPDHIYRVQFALANSTAPVQVKWNEAEIGTAQIPADENFYWHWVDFTALADTSSVRVLFKNLGAPLEQVALDAFSVIDLTAAPAISSQPTSISAVAGGTAAFFVGVNGSSPLSYQWFHGGNAIEGGTNRVLTLSSVTPEQSGLYQVSIYNSFGSVTSVLASLTVDSPTNATIVLQPYGDTIPAGSYFNLSVATAGTPPIDYQWFLNGNPIVDATNRNFALHSVQPADAGVYEVRVQNLGGIVWSLPARLAVTNALQGGGTIDFRNRSLTFTTVSNEAPVFDLDGTTPLNGPHYVAQLYAGTSLDSMRPIASPSAFRTGYYAGFFDSRILTLSHIPPGATVFAQVRVWESNKGSSYEEARALGGRFARSEILEVVAGSGPSSATRLAGLTSFHLEAGLPSFTVGVIDFVERQPGNTITWSLRGAPGFRYVVERSQGADPVLWRPFAIVTNTSGTVTFTDSANSGNGRTFYRARILD